MVSIIAKIKETLNFIQTCFSQASTQSGAVVGSNDDLLTEILLRLPVTSILRFKSVSKHWRSLLSDKHFTLLYDSLSKTHGLFMCRNLLIPNNYIPFDVKNPSPPPFRSLDSYFDLRDIKIVQSCNGLLLCCSEQGDHLGDCKYYVFNPTTKQSAIIPSPLEGDNIRRTICFMGLAFHQTECVHYKVVCVSWFKSNTMHRIQIYSSDTRKWKISVESFYAYHSYFKYGVYWNGAIHWAYGDNNHIYFKIEAEQIQTIPLPVEMTSSGTLTRYFGESRGHLHLIVIDIDCINNILHFNVNEMLSDCSGWFVKYQVQLDELPPAFPIMINPYGHDFSIVDVVRGEVEEDTFILVRIPGKMIKYNLHRKTFEQISSFSSVYYCEWCGAHRHITKLSSF